MSEFTTPGTIFDTISTAGEYTLSAEGAAGGKATSDGKSGGAGAAVGGDIYLTAGTVLEIIVGGEGDAAKIGGGGGGGSFIYDETTGTLLAAAGGGGGAGYYGTGGAGQAGTAGGAGTSGGDGGGGGGGGGGSHGAGGAGGYVNYSPGYTFGAGGGGGYSGAGGQGGIATNSHASEGGGGGGGAEFSTTGGMPGGAGNQHAGGDDAGGYGGGGGGSYGGGGGGGGYGGGGGGGSLGGGGGGGSYLTPDFAAGTTTDTGGVNSGSGIVDIVPIPVTFAETGSVQYDTIAVSGTYAIAADGAVGGAAVTEGRAGGAGAVVSGDIYLTAGTVLEIIVGGAGDAADAAGGGGGGSFIYDETTSTLLAAAAGGGGAGALGNGGPGQAGTAGGAGSGGAGGGSHGAGGGGGDFEYAPGYIFGAGGGGGYTGAGGQGGMAYDTHSNGGGGGGGAGFSTSGNMQGGAGNGHDGGPNSGGYGGGGGGGPSSGGGGGGYGGGGGGSNGGVADGGGGGGGSYDSDLTNGSAMPGANSGNGEVIIDLLCYLRGTRILTPTGTMLVEELVIGDAVVTRFGAVQRIKWLGRQRFAPAFLANNAEKWPVCIAAGALAEGVPARDLYVSPGHSMLLGDVLVLASRLVNGVTITQTRPERQVDYVQIELAAHDCVLAEGAWSETYADAPGQRAQFHNAAEFYALYPDEAPVETLQLCAERPERGPKLATALLPVVQRAEGAVPGVLEGWVERAGDWKIEGWVRDLARPKLPVRLEVLVDGQVIGTVLACEFREDLRQAGKGRNAFRFTPPFRLRAAQRSALVVRRAADGAELSGGAQIRAQAAA